MVKSKIIKQKAENIQLEPVLNEIDQRIIPEKERENILSEISRAAEKFYTAMIF